MKKVKEWYRSYEHINQEDVAQEMKDNDKALARVKARRLGGKLITRAVPEDDGIVFRIYK